MKRTGSIGSRGPARGHDDVAARRGRRRARLATSGGRRPDRAPGPAVLPTAATTASTIAGQLGQPADAGLPRCQRARLGLHDRVAEVVPQPRDVGPRRRMRPHVAVHGRRDDDRGRGRQARRGHDVAGEAVGHRAEPVRRRRARRRSRRRVSATTMWPIRPSGSSSSMSVSTGWRDSAANVSGADEPRRGRGQHDRDVGALGAQEPQRARRPCRRRSSR